MHLDIRIPHQYQPDTEPRLDRVVWPELQEDGATRIPRLDKDVAEFIQREVEYRAGAGNDRVEIITRSEAALVRLRLMMARGDCNGALTATILGMWEDHVDLVHVLPSGNIANWPTWLMSHTTSEVGALLRAQVDAHKLFLASQSTTPTKENL